MGRLHYPESDKMILEHGEIGNKRTHTGNGYYIEKGTEPRELRTEQMWGEGTLEDRGGQETSQNPKDTQRITRNKRAKDTGKRQREVKNQNQEHREHWN